MVKVSNKRKSASLKILVWRNQCLQDWRPLLFFIISQLILAFVVFVMSLACDKKCWTSWFKGFYTDSEAMYKSENKIINNSYCENKAITSFEPWVLTPVNSWSNYAFVFWGFVCITIGLRDTCKQEEIYKAEKSNHLKKHPEWIIFHGFSLIYGGVGSFAFHAGYTKLGHLFDMTGVFSMLGYPTLYAFFNLFLEDLNRYFSLGDVVSKLLAMAGFGFNIWLGFDR